MKTTTKTTDEPAAAEPSVLDTARIDYIDPVELTDTAELALEEPLADKIADTISTVIEEAKAAVATRSDKD